MNIREWGAGDEAAAPKQIPAGPLKLTIVTDFFLPLQTYKS